MSMSVDLETQHNLTNYTSVVITMLIEEEVQSNVYIEQKLISK